MRILLFLIVVSAGYSALASGTNSVSVALSTGVSQAGGRLRYEIGSFKDGSAPISRLTWPMNTTLVSGEACISSSAVEGRLQIGRNLTENSGVIEDVDYDGSDDREAIRSESQAGLTLWNADLSLLYRVFPRGKASTWSVGAGAGYAYRNMNWEASDLHQWTPSSPGIPDVYNSGLVATYEASLHMPYLQLVGRCSKPSWSLEGRLGYSPYFVIEDRDNHILRGILSETWAEGDGFRLEIQGQWHITGQWSLIAGVSGLDLYAAGSQHSRLYGSDISGVAWSEDKRIWVSEVEAQLSILYLLP